MFCFQAGKVKDEGEEAAAKRTESLELDTTVTGPWIGRWEIVNQNKHTDAFKKVTGQQSTPPTTKTQ